MNWERLIRKTLESLFAELFRGKRTRRGTRSARGRSASQHKHGYQVSGAESPGRYGAGATCDAKTAEIKSAVFGYQPNHDGDPDPGEVVWTWVPYQEADGRGKDRPVLILGRCDQETVIGCYLSTKQHRGFINIGSGPWDAEQRNSYLNPHRILRVKTSGMRREAAQVSRSQYDEVVKQLQHRGVL
ncbi:type II toxin-antitoxin system PemK/MazF family toxin [Canibacter zhoujuaniae]|uniref:type II toxin-antitoxin system PemK/MazF family toxin n=1 Tax=Canibacter zhoujuaniae TaxID=2708343 RepID=UPI00141D748A|nr:type II toxin-antitoxin system PemK/MazF family toxin [Canibacter zhoujuaniae]